MIIGQGIDIVDIARIKQAIERQGQAFIKRVFTPDEITYIAKHKFPYPHYAGRFAAKEAIFKAMGNPKLSWQDISIVNDAEGKPVCRYKNKNYKHRILISISHEKKYAVAQAIIDA